MGGQNGPQANAPGGLYRGSIAQVWLRPELFPVIGVLPGSATGSHIVNRETPVSPLGQPQLNVPEKKNHPRGTPLQPGFPKEPHYRRAADDSLAAKKPQGSGVICLEIERVKKGGEVKGLGHHLSAADHWQLRGFSIAESGVTVQDGVWCLVSLLHMAGFRECLSFPIFKTLEVSW
jgi:hypothetical protein